tara:strand:- start:1 stop:192 length:192 start_codon:yes stop_codon:yes gene_type:complete
MSAPSDVRLDMFFSLLVTLHKGVISVPLGLAFNVYNFDGGSVRCTEVIHHIVCTLVLGCISKL